MRSAILLILIGLLGCGGGNDRNYTHKTGSVKKGELDWQYCALHTESGDLIYAFFAQHAIKLTITDEVPEPEMGQELPAGIYWSTAERNGLWINGKRLVPTSQFYVIRANGGYVELRLTPAETAALEKGGAAGVTPKLYKDRLLPAFESR